MPLVLNMAGFWIYQGSEYAGITQGSEYAWVFSKHDFYINLWKRNASTPRKALWTSLKLWLKVENCYVIVKIFSPATGFSAHLAYFSLQYNFFTLLEVCCELSPLTIDVTWSKLQRYTEILRNKQLPVKPTLSKTMIETNGF